MRETCSGSGCAHGALFDLIIECPREAEKKLECAKSRSGSGCAHGAQKVNDFRRLIFLLPLDFFASIVYNSRAYEGMNVPFERAFAQQAAYLLVTASEF